MLIVIEGLDGAGKSTQVRLLKEKLQGLPRPLTYIHFPRYEAPVYGSLITRFLKGEFGALEAVHPQLVALLFAEDRHGAAADIRSRLEKGENVLLDRYVYSNIAYQCAKLASETQARALRDWIFETEYGAFGIPRPDLNLFLDVPVSFVEQNLSAQRSGSDRNYLGEGGQDIHEADINFQRRVRAMYLEECRRDKDFLRVDCAGEDGRMLPAEQIAAHVGAVVDDFLKNTEKV